MLSAKICGEILKILFKFEIQAKLLWKVIAADAGAHDNVVCFADQRQFGSLVIVLHWTYLLSFESLHANVYAT